MYLSRIGPSFVSHTIDSLHNDNDDEITDTFIFSPTPRSRSLHSSRKRAINPSPPQYGSRKLARVTRAMSTADGDREESDETTEGEVEDYSPSVVSPDDSAVPSKFDETA